MEPGVAGLKAAQELWAAVVEAERTAVVVAVPAVERAAPAPWAAAAGQAVRVATLGAAG